jgi:hypothetical protein
MLKYEIKKNINLKKLPKNKMKQSKECGLNLVWQKIKKDEIEKITQL